MVQLLAATGLGIPDIGLFIVKCLAIVGGVAVGAAGCPWGVRLLVRLVTGQKLPERVATTFRILGGVALGLLVWTWVFSVGGAGGMGGSGSGWWPFGQGGGPGEAIQSSKLPETTETIAKVERAPAPTDDALTIHLLGGARVHEQRFYVLDRDSPRNFDDLKKTILERRKARPILARVEILIYEDSVDRDNPAVTELMKWAKEQGFTYKLSIVGQAAP